jgi:hypothetical protein
MAGQERLQRQRVEGRALGGVVDRVRREQVQHDGDVAEVQVEIDQGDLGAVAGEADGQVGRQERLAAAPLGTEDGGDLAGGPALTGLGGRAAAQAPAQCPGDLDGPGRGGPDGPLVAGRGQDVLDAHPQRLADQLARLLTPDQHHRHVRGALLQGAGQGERLAVGEARPDDGGEHVPALGGHGRRGLVGVGRPDHTVGQPREGVGQPGGVAVVRFDDQDGHHCPSTTLPAVTPWLCGRSFASGANKVM